MKSYVKVFCGHDVPYGATKYQEGTERFHESFWDNDGNVWVIGISKKWVKSASVAPENLIPLPEQPIPSKAEWMPEVGVECEIAKLRDTLSWNKGVVDFYGKEKCIVTFYDGREAAFLLKEIVLRPVKTAEEKKREAFIEGVKQLFPKSDADDLILAGKLFDAGYTAPKEGEL